MNKNLSVQEIVIAYLKQNGYDGLYNDDCGCTLDDFMPCGEVGPDCSAGYRMKCNCEDCKKHGCVTIIVPDKED